MAQEKMGAYVDFDHYPERHEVAECFKLLAQQASYAIQKEETILIDQRLSVMLYIKRMNVDDLLSHWEVGFLLRHGTEEKGN